MKKAFFGLCMALVLLLAIAATVTQAATGPMVTINIPGENSEFLYDSDIPVSVAVESKGEALTGEVIAFLDDNTDNRFSLDFDAKENVWAVDLSGVPPGHHTFTVSATNASGTGTATDSFAIYVNFGQWLPPLAGPNMKLKQGSILPIRFTIIGANGPLDDSDIKPEVLLDDKVVGQAATVVDSATGLPYFQVKVKIPKKNCRIGVRDPDIKQGTQTRVVTVK
jgi:hypothetical protein